MLSACSCWLNGLVLKGAPHKVCFWFWPSCKHHTPSDSTFGPLGVASLEIPSFMPKSLRCFFGGSQISALWFPFWFRLSGFPVDWSTWLCVPDNIGPVDRDVLGQDCPFWFSHTLFLPTRGLCHLLVTPACVPDPRVS